MSISTSLVHHSLISIEVGNLWDVLAGVLRAKPAADIGVADYARRLSDLVRSSSTRQPLYVSVGTADFLAPWLTRLYAEQSTEMRSSEACVHRVVIKHIDFGAAAALEAAGALEPNFVERLKLNIDVLQRDPDLARQQVVVQTCVWRRLPLFHGYLFGDTFLIGPWRVGAGGHLHVKTSLVEATRAELPNVHKYLTVVFGEAAT